MDLGLILGIILLVLAAAIVVLVLLQSNSDSKLSGTIAGGADTFYGKTKGADKNKVLTIVTSDFITLPSGAFFQVVSPI